MPDTTRTDLPADLAERSVLLTMLDYTRKTAVMKCEGLSDEDGRRALLPGSPLMTMSGIISHLRWVEWSWIQVRLLGLDDPGPWTDNENDPDREMHFRLDWPLVDVVADYQELARWHDTLFESFDLDKVAAQRTRNGQEITFRWIVHHLIEENARHNGHLDIIREMLDGTTGD